MRWVLCFFVAFVGCVATLPADHTITADMAAETARMVVELRQQIPPTPTPPSDGKCIPCNGTGTLPTDGRIVIKCEACGGTGKARK